MKKLLAFFIGMVMVFGIAGMAGADTYTFNFNTAGDSQTELNTYLGGIFSGANASNLKGDTDFNLGDNSRIIRTTQGSAGTIDFDVAAPGASEWKIVSVSFDWGVYNATSGIDFGLDVFDDVSNSWQTNVFTRNLGSGTYGFSGLITFDPSYQVTQIRIHDSQSHDVGIDDLLINDNRSVDPPGAVPEPATMLLLGSGLVGLAGFARRRFKK
jgi:hypothetical protein